MQMPGEMFIVEVLPLSLALCSLSLVSPPLLRVGNVGCGLSDIYFHGRAQQRSSRASEGCVVSVKTEQYLPPCKDPEGD